METFATITAQLAAGNALVTLANVPPNPTEYLFERFLPTVQRTEYEAQAGGMTINTVMAGHVGMDSPYPQGSSIQLSSFSEKTAKLAQAITLPEQAHRELQRFLNLARLGQLGTTTPADLMSEAGLNLFEKGVVQALDDTREYLRASAIMKGKIDWTFGGRKLLVDYGIPSANKPAKRTGNDAYHGTSSKFWADYRDGQRKVGGADAVVVSENTLNAIIDNPANKIRVESDTESAERNIRTVTFVRSVQTADGINVGDDRDARYRGTLIAYRRSGLIIDPTAPGATIGVQMVPDGVMAFIGSNNAAQLISTTGTALPQRRLGYYHVAPTVEGSYRGAPLGRWGRLYSPEGNAYELRAEGVENGLPVIENEKKLAIYETEMPS